MPQYKLDEVRRMTFEQIGAVEDPVDLMASGSMAPILVRYIARTGQLEHRYPRVAQSTLLDAILQAAGKIPCPLDTVAHQAPQARKNADVDAYLDELDPHVQRALKPG